jgi:hypothetical protein
MLADNHVTDGRLWQGAPLLERVGFVAAGGLFVYGSLLATLASAVVMTAASAVHLLRR